MRKGGKKILLSDSFVKPYVKVEGLPDLLLRYERDKEFNESGSDGNYCILESFIEGSIFFFTIAKVWMMIICFCWIIIMNPDI